MPPKFTTDRDPLLDCCRTADVRLCALPGHSIASMSSPGADMPWRGIITFAPGAQMQPSRLARPSTDLLHGPRGFECQVSEFDD
jgi:hypothetical protein